MRYINPRFTYLLTLLIYWWLVSEAVMCAWSVSEAVQTVTGESLPAHVKSLQLEINCVDDSGSELKVPFVKYNFRSPWTPSVCQYRPPYQLIWELIMNSTSWHC